MLILYIFKQEADAMRNGLDVKEKELVALEEKLDARERVSFLQLIRCMNMYFSMTLKWVVMICLLVTSMCSCLMPALLNPL